MYELNMFTSAGDGWSTPTVLTAVVISLQTSGFRLPFSLFRLPNNPVLFFSSSPSVSSSEMFLFFAYVTYLHVLESGGEAG